MTQSDRRDEPDRTIEDRHAAQAHPTGLVEPDMTTIEKARQGDLRAFEQLYRGSVARVNALCLRLCAGDATRAQDFVQEVYLHVWERLGSFEGRAQFSTWLYRVAVNRVTDLMRIEIRRSELAPTDPVADAGIAANSRGPEMRIDLESGIRALPSGARLVFVLHDVEGYGHEEIAAMTGLSAGTSKSQLHRARQLLRARLSQ